MNFFQYQEVARRKTKLLVVYYILAVAFIILALYTVSAIIFRYEQASIPDQPFNWLALWDPSLFFIVAAVVGSLIAIGTTYKIIALSGGGEAVANMLGARPISPDTTQFQEKRLLNVIEEMAIASGTPIPRVFIMDDEEGINAFAAGFSPKDAIIGVTRGAVTKLNRDELQGVIGHEFSHILNGDMRLNIRLIGVLNGILIIAVVGYWMFRIIARTSGGGSSRDKKGNPLVVVMLLGLAMMVIGYIGVFFARLIKSAISRQREFLADASSVQFTRNPDGLAGALKKIGGLLTGSRLQAPAAESASHLFFANGVGNSFLGLLSTHPPLEERLQRLDPSFTGIVARTHAEVPESDGTPLQELHRTSLTAMHPAGGPPPLIPPLIPVTPGDIVNRTGTLSAAALTQASLQLDALPAALQDAARTPHRAQAVIFALLLNQETVHRATQMERLKTEVSADLVLDTESFAQLLAPLPAHARHPLAELAVSGLRHLDPAVYPAFRGIVMDLIAADSQVSLFEYMILRMMLRNLDPQFGITKRPKPLFGSLNAVADEVTVVLSALAWFGTNKPSEATRAFEIGRSQLGAPSLTLCTTEQASLAAMDKALDRLAECKPPLKERLIAAFSAVVASDGTVTLDESEALRATADALDCPIPPFMNPA